MGTERPDKIRIGIIFGGRSGEHEVSLESARSVMGVLDPARYEVVPVGITRDGRWLTGDAWSALAEGHNGSDAATLLPDPNGPGLLRLTPPGGQSLALISKLDVIFPVLHGPYGEDGTMQGLLELANIPYVGAGVTGSAVAMDKAIFKQIMTASNLPVLPWLLVGRHEWLANPAAIIERIEANLAYPVFTKPANLGSSVGISKCGDRAELEAGLAEAARYDRRIVVEQGIDRARELEVAVLGNEEPIASVVGEVRPRRAFYDYVAKYLIEPGGEEESELLIPAPISAEMAATVRTMAVHAYAAVDCAGLGRVDLLLDDSTGKLFLNEINTIPGFTRISMYPKLWEASGVSYAELVDRLVELALARHRQKAELETTFNVAELTAKAEEAADS